MRIGILGSGRMGGALGTIFARTGHEVIFSCARAPHELKRLARAASATARHGTPREAAEQADTLLLAVHWSRMDDVLRQAGELSGKLIITCSLPMNADNSGLVIAHTSSGAEELAKKVPGTHVVSAFNTVPGEALPAVFYAARRRTPRPSLAFCGDHSEAKRSAAGLIEDAGFEPVDCGALKMARYTEPYALLLGALASSGKFGPNIAYRFERIEPPDTTMERRKQRMRFTI